MPLVSMRLPETPWISEWKKEKLTISYHHHTDSTSSNNYFWPTIRSKPTQFPVFSIKTCSHERVVSLVVLQNHWQYVTHVFLAIHRLPSPLPLALNFLLPHSCSLHSRHRSLQLFRDMAPAVRQSTCMCICRAATCSKTPPITSVTGRSSCGGATWALSLFHALVDRGLRRTRAKWLWMLEAGIPRGEQRNANSRRSAAIEGMS